jgi:diguanylate cyclase (GGDEF)-like protein
MAWRLSLLRGRARTVLFALLLGAIAMAALAGVFVPLDNALRDARFLLTTRGTTGDTVFVDIDSASLKSVGVWPWPRHLHAQMLDTLMRLGATDVVFDIDFSAASTEAEDAAFERSLADAGGYAYLAAFLQHSSATSGAPAFNLPLPRFAKNAAPVAVNVSLDTGGLVRTYPLALRIGGAIVPSAASVLAGRTASTGGSAGIDFSIDPASIRRVSAADLLDGSVDPALVSGRQVVIGASAVELRDYFVVPRYGILPGALLQILAGETLKQGRALAVLGPLPALGALLFFVTLGGMTRRRLGVVWIGFAALSIAVGAELVADLLQFQWAALLDTAALDIGLAASWVTVLIGELRRRGAEKRRAEERLIYLATHDPLTGTMSRTSFVAEIEAAAESAVPFAVIAFDLRRFRPINNTLGHAQGDRLLKQVATRLANVAPGAIARLGGDSFSLLLPRLEAGSLTGLCRVIIDHLSFPYELGGHQATIAASCGVAVSDVSGADPETLLAHADMALAAAKRRSDGGVAIFAPEMHTALVERQTLDAALRSAVLNGEIGLHYQPQVDLRTGAAIGVEALARWKTAELGAVSPQRFIAAAEETGLIVEIGRRALQVACAQAASWPDEIRMAVNVSPVQFELSDVAADVAAALKATGLDPARLDIEITEGVFVSNLAATTGKLEAIRRMGVGIALDDFGTGYSSLAYLGRLPIDKIKIDQSFVRRLPADREAQAIVATVMSLARALDKTVVAEGIETADQAALLAANGCQIGQGYYFGRPVPAGELSFATPAPFAVAS